MGQVKKFSRMAKLYKPGGSGISVSSDASACFQRNEQKKQEAMKTPPQVKFAENSAAGTAMATTVCTIPTLIR